MLLPSLMKFRSNPVRYSPGISRIGLILLVAFLSAVLISTTVVTPVMADDPLGSTRGHKSSTDKLRNVSQITKDKLKAAARIPRSQWGNYEIDHKTPLWRGGNNNLSNLQVLSKAQHRAKTAAEARQRARFSTTSIGKTSVPRSSKSKITLRSKAPSSPRIKSFSKSTKSSSSRSSGGARRR